MTFSNLSAERARCARGRVADAKGTVPFTSRGRLRVVRAARGDQRAGDPDADETGDPDGARCDELRRLVAHHDLRDMPDDEAEDLVTHGVDATPPSARASDGPGAIAAT